ncbi:MAG: zf-HC2 domain-containing protein [Lachnospiraceae bacterium]|nr:zf-HC2 domain-containing protein [Lachnospiraceae bacterium]
MKNKEISCQVIQDILPLYEDGCCSEDSKNLVEEHLKTCTECQKLVSRYEEPVPVREEEKEPEVVSIQRGVRQIKRGKVAGFIALALVVAVFFVVIPLKNYIVGDGVTYANLKEIYMARSFGNAIAEGNYEKAYSYFTIEQDYDDLMEQYDEEGIEDSVKEGINQIKNNGFGWYDQICHDAFIESMNEVQRAGKRIKTCSYKSSVKQIYGWTLFFDGELESGESVTLQFDMTSDGIQHYCVMKNFMVFDEKSGEFVEDEEARKLDDDLLQLYEDPCYNSTIFDLLYPEEQ